MATLTRTLRRGVTGEDVREVQQLLQQAGYDPGTIDGIFGVATETATKNFQQDNNLSVDGAVGPKTYAALVQSLGSPTGTVRGRSLHIGLNRVNDSAYPGFRIPVLRGCINDANDMRAIAQAHGFVPAPNLHDGQATAEAVIDAISSAAQSLSSGDIFLLTYSGHGSQVPDLDAEETDHMDETWILYDRQLLDDELYALWGQFAPDVRILMFSDSCHSGTMSRAMVEATERDVAERDLVRRGLSREVDPAAQFTAPGGTPPDEVQLTLSLAATVRPLLAAVAGGRTGPELELATGQVITPVLDRIGATHRALATETALISKLLPVEDAAIDFRRRSKLYRAAKAMTRRSVPPVASILLFSGCQDNQTSLDGVRNGLFTQNLKLALAENPANYPDLHRSISAKMPGSQTPNMSWVPFRNVAFEGQTPFAVQ